MEATLQDPPKSTSRLPFTDERIRRLPRPAKGQVTYYDGGGKDSQTGLGVRVSQGGAKTFIVYQWFRGKPIRVSLGRYPKIKVKKARELARKELSRFAEGINPNKAKQAERVAARRDIPFSEFFKEYVRRHAEPHTRGGAEKARRTYELHLKPWAKRPLSSITHSDVQQMHARVAKGVAVRKKDGKASEKPLGGPRAANLAVALVRHMFNKARAWGYREGDNPAIGVQLYKEKPRERWLRADEMPKFWEALAAEPNQDMADIFLTLLLTGARKGNVLAMRWDQVNLDRGTWEIPGAESKAGNRIEIQLHRQVVEVLQRRRKARRRRSPWVFSSRNKTGHITEIKTAWRKFTARAGFSDLRPHDLRHTWASWQVASGVHLRVVSAALGHKSPLTVNRYAHVDSKPVRAAVQLAGDAMMIAAGVQQERAAPRPKATGRLKQA